MLRVTFKIATILFAGMACSGCVQENAGQYQASLLERNWGQSFETAKNNQIYNPEAQNNLTPVENIEGVLAVRTFGDHVSGKKETKKSSQFGILTVKQ